MAQKDKVSVNAESTDWNKRLYGFRQNLDEDKINGISYVVSGSLALLGGVIGSTVSVDPLESITYSLFQTIGIASIGYGAYKWKIGNEDRIIFQFINNTSNLSVQDKLKLLESYKAEKLKQNKEDRFIRSVTHGLISVVNFYNASLQDNNTAKNTLNFIGIANLLAFVTYSF